MLKEVSKEQAKIIEKMVLDKKTNKEIAEATGLKYWEVRDYVQYVGLAGIREQMSGRKPGRRKKDGYNKEKNGPNADRHLCKTCIYRGTVYCHIHSIGVIIDLNNFNGQGAYLPHRGRARTSHRHCEKKHTPEKNSVERRNKWQSTEA